MPYHGIDISKSEITRFCRLHHIRKLALFGSILRQDFNQDSDVDVLVEFERGYEPGFIQMAGFENELSEMLCRKVDLRTRAELSRYFRDEVERESEVQYAQR